MAKTIDNRNLDKIADDANLQDIKNDDTPIVDDVSTETNTTDEPGNTEEDPVEEAPVEETPAEKTPVKEAPKEEPKKEEPDYKKKFKASSSEASTQFFKNKQMQEKIDEASALPDPTLEELQAEARTKGSEYEDLDTFAQGMLKDSIIATRRFSLIKEANDKGKELDGWAKSVDDFTNSVEVVNKYPSLEGSEADFKKYSMKEARRGMDMEDLLTGFLFQRQGDDPTPKPAKKKEDIFLTGGGGGDTIPKPPELTAEEVRVIRSSNPDRYKQLVKDGKAGLELLDRD